MCGDCVFQVHFAFTHRVAEEAWIPKDESGCGKWTPIVAWIAKRQPTVVHRH